MKKQQSNEQKSQGAIIIAHLKRFPATGVTLKELREQYDIATPNARITELIRAGWDIKKSSEPVLVKGRPSHRTRYKLGKKKKGLPLVVPAKR